LNEEQLHGEKPDVLGDQALVHVPVDDTLGLGLSQLLDLAVVIDVKQVVVVQHQEVCNGWLRQLLGTELQIEVVDELETFLDNPGKLRIE